MTDCIFCQIVDKKIPADLVYQDENFLAFYDIKPVALIHVVIIPKQHLELKDFEKIMPDLPNQLVQVAKQLARKLKIEESGWRLVVNNGPDSGQEIAHCHWHLLGGGRLGPIA